jgi:crotonobetainyl-CoA:carnitine CoA-transferase CaiB-like acyl-CoA transferase
MTSTSGGALAGVRVVDLSRVLAGPYCTQMMGDHGADVLKIEPPNGDGTRIWGETYENGVSAYYAGLNRNKRHLSVDLSRQEGRDLVLELLDGADVLVENFKPGTMERWGIGPDVLLERFPKLVYCRVTAFGTGGPMGGLPGYDAVIQAFSGIMSMNGEPESGPVRVPMPITDIVTGMLAHMGVLLALNERHRSGRGQLVDLTLLDSALTLLHPAAANYFLTGRRPERIGTAHPNIAPCDTFETSAGHLYVAAGTDKQFQSLCAYLGSPELAADPRFVTNTDRLHHREELSTELQSLVGRMKLDGGAAREMIALGIPASVIRPVDEVLADPQIEHRQMVEELDGLKMLGIPLKLGRTPGSVRTPPKPRGADTGSALAELGFTPEQIAELRRNGAIPDADSTAGGFRRSIPS